MAFCSQCGTKLADGAAFCSACGAPATSHQEPGIRRDSFEGEIRRCPSCGQVLDAFEPVCPACGFELRNVKASASLKELSQQLQQISLQSNKGASQTLLERLRRDSTDADDRASSLIKAFPIPNTKEDLIEFIIASAANINVDAFNDIKRGNLSATDIAMSNAWLSKLEQAYQKAEIALERDEDFPKVRELYERKLRQVASARKAMLKFWIGWLILMGGLIAFCLIMSVVTGS